MLCEFHHIEGQCVQNDRTALSPIRPPWHAGQFALSLTSGTGTMVLDVAREEASMDAIPALDGEDTTCQVEAKPAKNDVLSSYGCTTSS